MIFQCHPSFHGVYPNIDTKNDGLFQMYLLSNMAILGINLSFQVVYPSEI